MDYHKATQDAPDYTDLFRATKELSSELSKLSAMSKDVAAAQTAMEFSSDRRKNALARSVMDALKSGSDSTAKAEHAARASATYEVTMKQLAKDYAQAELVLTEFKTSILKVESLRSIIAVHRQIAGIQ